VFFAGAIYGLMVIIIGYQIGKLQNISLQSSLVEWAQQFNNKDQRDLAEWSLNNSEVAMIASRLRNSDIEWIASKEGQYAKRFFKANHYLISGDCPTNLLKSRTLNGRTVCTVWRVDP
ncbi:MAG: hypothetical protein AAF403_02725, partial [Pseudomonadota bacterium]